MHEFMRFPAAALPSMQNRQTDRLHGLHREVDTLHAAQRLQACKDPHPTVVMS
jgi:hypothetical protein